MIHFLWTAVVSAALLLVLVIIILITGSVLISITRVVMLTKENCAKLTRNVLRSLVEQYGSINEYTPFEVVDKHIEKEYTNILIQLRGNKK